MQLYIIARIGDLPKILSSRDDPQSIQFLIYCPIHVPDIKPICTCQTSTQIAVRGYKTDISLDYLPFVLTIYVYNRSWEPD